MTLITLRTFIETDLADTPLQVILDAVNEDITAAVGTDTSQVETLKGEGQAVYWIERPVSSFTTIIETDSGGTAVTLAVDDYELDGNKQAITRLNTGTNPKSGWTDTIVFTYVPADLNRRNRAIVQLVELDLAFRPGARQESIGDLSRGMQNYDDERARIISQAMSKVLA
jgi:hypothetical protein